MKWIKSQKENRERLTKALVGQAKNCIHSHGPIDFKSNNINSLRKRLRGPLREYVLIRRPSTVLKEIFLCSNKKISAQCKANRKWKEENKKDAKLVKTQNA
jgi:hypothetical protein